MVDKESQFYMNSRLNILNWFLFETEKLIKKNKIYIYISDIELHFANSWSFVKKRFATNNLFWC